MIGIGTDIIEISRVRKSLNDAFLRKVLSPYEIRLCVNFRTERIIEYVAGRFAAKEAIIKALSDYELPRMQDIIILNDEKGKPVVTYKNFDILVSISHEKEYAVATAVLRGFKQQ